jgi:hypothetical protein
LTSSVGSSQNLAGDRERPDHPTPAGLIRNPLQVGPGPYLIRLELPGGATGDHDSSLPVRLLHSVMASWDTALSEGTEQILPSQPPVRVALRIVKMF